jgi:7-cyano-7-deazaguanine synthase
MRKKAVVLLSGGLDSATVLAIAQSQDRECYALSFNYGQRSNSELNAAKKLANINQVVEHKIIDLDFLQQIKGSALTDHSLMVPDYKKSAEIPITYVPVRNTLFLVMALGWAEVLGAQEIYIGVSSVDYSGYTDCRPEYYVALQNLCDLATKSAGSGENIAIKTPLLYLSKAETIAQGLQLNVNYADTVTCYQADENGHACGKCDSCTLRREGFVALGVTDPTRYQIEKTG